MKRLFFLAIWFTFAGLSAQRYANEFLHIGVGADAMGMSGAVTAQTSGPFSAYWNPAALPSVTDPSVGLMHGSLFQNLAQLDYAVYTRPKSDKETVAAGILRLGVDNIMNTTRLIDEEGNVDYNRITYFSAADYALMLSYGRQQIMDKWDAGVTLKIIYRHIGDFARAYGFGFDAGIRYAFNGWTWAAVLRDATSTFSYWSFNEERLAEIQAAVPGENTEPPPSTEWSFPRLQTGIARYFPIKKDYGLTAELDLRIDFYERPALIQSTAFSMEPAVGLEGHYKHKIFLRTGIQNIYRTEYFGEPVWQFNPSAGTGIRFKYIQLDYAFTGMSEKGFYTHVFSLMLDTRLFKKER